MCSKLYLHSRRLVGALRSPSSGDARLAGGENDRPLCSSPGTGQILKSRNRLNVERPRASYGASKVARTPSQRKDSRQASSRSRLVAGRSACLFSPPWTERPGRKFLEGGAFLSSCRVRTVSGRDYWATGDEGSRTSRRVPLLSEERILNSPPMTRTRSAMLTSPRPPFVRSVSNPRPSSEMASVRLSPEPRSVTWTTVAIECLAAF